MIPRIAHKRINALARALTTVLASVAGGAVFALPAQADSPEVSHTPQHVWVDPTVPNPDGDYEWSFTINMPVLTEFSVISANAPQFTTGSVQCLAPEPVGGGILSCVGEGDAIPGD